MTLERPVKDADIRGRAVRLVVWADAILPAFAKEFCRLVTEVANATCRLDMLDPLLAMDCERDDT